MTDILPILLAFLASAALLYGVQYLDRRLQQRQVVQRRINRVCRKQNVIRFPTERRA